jgi:hypothetical protein
MRIFSLSLFVLSVFISACTSAAQPQPISAQPPAPFQIRKRQPAEITRAKPRVRQNGIHFGSKSLIVAPDGTLRILADDKELAAIYLNLNTPAKKWMTQRSKAFRNKKLAVDVPNGQFTFTANFPVDDPSDHKGVYSHSARVLPDGLIEVEVAFSVPETSNDQIKQKIMFITMPFSFCEGKSYKINDTTSDFADANTPKTDRPKSLYIGKASSFSFTPGDIATCFSLDKIAAKGLNLRENRLKSGRSGANCALRIFPRNGKITFRLDLRKSTASDLVKSTDSHEGIDFWKADRLHVPDYTKSHNLIQNPSFEAGLRYYAFSSLGRYQESSHENLYECAPGKARFGNHSLLIHAVKTMTSPCAIGTFAIPVEKGQRYTVSCYARGDRDKGLTLKLSSVSGKWPVFPKLGTCRITPEWQRYEFSFVAPNNVISIFLRGAYSGDHSSGEGAIWVDGLQMEKGKLSEFAEKPVCARFTTSNADNFLTPDAPVNAKLTVSSAVPHTSGKARVEVTDFYYRKLYEKTFTFTTNQSGIASIDLPFESRFSRGVFVVGCTLSLDNSPEDTDYFRFSIMDALTNTHKNKHITASGVSYFRIPRCEALLERCRAIGIGNDGYSTMASDEIKKMNEYGIEQNVGHILRYRTAQSGGLQIRGNRQKRHLIEPLPKLEHVTPEFLKTIEEASYEKTTMYPLITTWMLDGEPNQRHKWDGLTWDEIIAVHRAAYRGVKRANPKATFINGGPTNMMPRGGTEWVRQFLVAGGNTFCDGSAIHPYRTVPEDPDLDADAAAYFKMLDTNGMKNCPVFWLEGIYHTNYVLPAFGLDSHKACSTDHYRCGAVSYHMGWGERIAAAYYARSWLVGLKYATRVKTYNGWAGKALYMDVNLTPFALQKIPNTLGRILGNADFKQDIRFAPKVRCYVFEDEQKRPVAAVWSHLARVDRGYDPCPTALIPFKTGAPTFLDLMEAPFTPETDQAGRIRLPISSFPTFIRGKAGTLASFCQSLQNASLETMTAAPLKLSITPAENGKIELSVVNLLSREFRGSLSIPTTGQTLARELTIPARKAQRIHVPLAKELPFDSIDNVNLPLKFKEHNRTNFEMDASFNGFAVMKRGTRPITIDGNDADWQGIPEIKMQNRMLHKNKFGNQQKVGYPGDLEATFSMLWDDDHLYLAVRVIDDKFVRVPNEQGKFGWQNDTLQVYIDTLCDARSKTVKGYDTNDYNYDFFPMPEEHRAVAFRRVAPEQQITGGTNPLRPNEIEPNVKAAFKLTDTGYTYEIAFPKKYIVPVPLKAGEYCGFCIFLNDRDNPEIKKRGVMKAALTLTPEGTGAHMNPHLYPVMLLTNKTAIKEQK